MIAWIIGLCKLWKTGHRVLHTQHRRLEQVRTGQTGENHSLKSGQLHDVHYVLSVSSPYIQKLPDQLLSQLFTIEFCCTAYMFYSNNSYLSNPKFIILIQAISACS